DEATLDRVMEFPELRRLPTIVDGDDVRAREHIRGELLLRRLVRSDSCHVGAGGEPLRLDQGTARGRGGDDNVSLVYRMFDGIEQLRFEAVSVLDVSHERLRAFGRPRGYVNSAQHSHPEQGSELVASLASSADDCHRS